MKNITLRRATISDLAAIQELNRKLCVKEHQEFDPTINTEYSFSKEGGEYFAYRIERDDSATFVAENDNRIIGYLAGGLIKKEDYLTIQVMAEAENMFIDESFRGQGIGGMLLSQFEEWCKTKGVERIRFVASAQNEKAIKFYKEFGAREISVTLEKDI